MGQQYQDTISSFAASPQAMDQQQPIQTAGNNTPGKSLEQSPMHDGFGTRSGMYDNGMDVSAQPAPVATPPQPQSQPASAGINPSWAQQGRKRGGRAKRADGGQLPGWASGPISPYMMTGDTLAKMPQQPQPVPQNVPPAMTSSSDAAGVYTDAFPTAGRQAPSYADLAGLYGKTQLPGASLYKQGLSNEDFLNQAYQQELGRAPEKGGLDYWLNQLGSGMSQQDVENQILNSPEERNKSYVDELYNSVFGRQPDQSGEQYWRGQLDASKMTPGQVAAGFMNSPEAAGSVQQGILPAQPGQVDPFVAGYNARMANAQNLYGSIAQQNYSQNTADQEAYQQQLQKVQDANQQRLAAAQQAKADRQAREAEAARQQQLMLMLMMMKH